MNASTQEIPHKYEPSTPYEDCNVIMNEADNTGGSVQDGWAFFTIDSYRYYYQVGHTLTTEDDLPDFHVHTVVPPHINYCSKSQHTATFYGSFDFEIFACDICQQHTPLWLVKRLGLDLVCCECYDFRYGFMV